jgi:hypothetical protein
MQATIGIDKGISLLMLANYQNDIVYDDDEKYILMTERLQIVKNRVMGKWSL